MILSYGGKMNQQKLYIDREKVQLLNTVFSENTILAIETSLLYDLDHSTRKELCSYWKKASHNELKGMDTILSDLISTWQKEYSNRKTHVTQSHIRTFIFDHLCDVVQDQEKEAS